MSKKVANNEAMYHWMVAAQVVFTGKGGAEEGGVITINAMVLTKENLFNAHALAQAQRTVTANMQERFANPDMGIIDIVFLSISNLGYFTQEGFNPDNSVKPI